ncbi:hypothetical protein RclHR1_02360002 [Rhizophagus clarus]|uniref:Uncharacterized protein n=1 Tax=Rhizophagus clarus TaxID=94130 RepID=A0A2Z6R9H0_9GLOM|nr:hypothetical protein RclHR1_02360002 [Rhizophagus clarus]
MKTANEQIITGQFNKELKDRNDRRYLIPDILEKYDVNNGISMDHYYAPLDSTIKDPEVGKAFYSYILEYVKLNPDFNERKIPMIKTKLMMVNKNNNKVHEFIKENYVIWHRNLDESSSILYHNFKAWFATYASSNKKPHTVQEFTYTLEELEIKAKQKRIEDQKAVENIKVPEGYEESEVLIEIPSERLSNSVYEQEKSKLEQESKVELEPCEIPDLSNLSILQEVSKPAQKALCNNPDSIPKMNITKYWEWVDRTPDITNTTHNHEKKQIDVKFKS